MTRTLLPFALLALALGVAITAINLGDNSSDEHTAHSAADAHVQVQHEHHHPSPLPADEPLPGKSVYHLPGTWLDHYGNNFDLQALRGKPVVVVMFYASCDTMCPILIRDAMRIENELPEELKEWTQFLMVTIDPENDAPERMARYVDQNNLSAPNWHFLSGPETQTRALASILGVSYRASGDGHFSHSNLVTLLDLDGVITVRAEGLMQSPDPALAAIHAMSSL